jgi:hypothetical protein
MQRTIFDTPVVNTLMHWLSRLLLQLMGWRVEGGAPNAPKYVLIAVPHTSNWDFPVTLMVCFALRLKVYWMALMAWLGGIPVNRARAKPRASMPCASIFGCSATLRPFLGLFGDQPARLPDVRLVATDDGRDSQVLRRWPERSRRQDAPYALPAARRDGPDLRHAPAAGRRRQLAGPWLLPRQLLPGAGFAGPDRRLAAWLFDSLLRLPNHYFDQQNSGHLISRITYDVTMVTGAATEAIKVVIREG